MSIPIKEGEASGLGRSTWERDVGAGGIWDLEKTEVWGAESGTAEL